MEIKTVWITITSSTIAEICHIPCTGSIQYTCECIIKRSVLNSLGINFNLIVQSNMFQITMPKFKFMMVSLSAYKTCKLRVNAFQQAWNETFKE